MSSTGPKQRIDLKLCKPGSMGGHAAAILGRFVDPVPLPEPATASANTSAGASSTQPLHMHYMEEDIAEDVRIDSEPTSEFYSRRRRRRYKNKSSLVIEDNASAAAGPQGRRPMGSLCLHGTPVDLSTEGASGRTRYVLFEMNKVPASVPGGESRVEINVVPIEQSYTFRKAPRAAAVSLDELEISFEQNEKRKALANKKYASLMRTMESRSKEFEAKTAGGKTGFEEDEGATGAAAPGASGKADVTDLAFGAPVLGSSVSKSLRRGGRSSMKSFRGFMDDDGNEEYGGGGGGGGGGDEEGEGGLGGGRDDNDIDHTEDIDFDEQFSDDDDDAAGLQKLEEENEETHGGATGSGGRAVRGDEAGGGTDSEDEEFGPDSEEDEEGAAGQSEDAQNALAGAAKEFNVMLKQKRLEREAANDAASDSGGSVEEGGSGKAAKRAKREGAGLPARGSEGSLQGAVATSSSSTAPTAELSEVGVRAYMQSVGGRARTRDLLEHFKKPLRALGAAGQSRLKELLKLVVVSIEDPVMGKILVLK